MCRSCARSPIIALFARPASPRWSAARSTAPTTIYHWLRARPASPLKIRHWNKLHNELCATWLCGQNTTGQLVDAAGRPASALQPSVTQPSYTAASAATGVLNSYASSVTNSAKSGSQQTVASFEQAQRANNPVQLLEGAAAMDAGAINTATAPIAPLTKPLSNAVNYAADKISNIPAVQNFATSPAGNTTARVTQDIANLNTIAGAVAPTAGVSKLSSAEALNAAELAKQTAPSPAGAGWGSASSLADHFARHGSDFSATSPTDYANKAQSFYNSANTNGFLVKIDNSGTTRIYDPNTNTFGSYSSSGNTKTFFKPNPTIHGYPSNIDYWNAQPGH